MLDQIKELLQLTNNPSRRCKRALRRVLEEHVILDFSLDFLARALRPKVNLKG
jgi:hypothetical protein